MAHTSKHPCEEKLPSKNVQILVTSEKLLTFDFDYGSGCPFEVRVTVDTRVTLNVLSNFIERHLKVSLDQGYFVVDHLEALFSIYGFGDTLRELVRDIEIIPA